MLSNCDSTRKSLVRSMKQRSQSPIGNWLHSKPTTIRIGIRGWCRLIISNIVLFTCFFVHFFCYDKCTDERVGINLLPAS